MINKKEVYKLLELHKNERGIVHWRRIGHEHWSSFGIGLTQLKKLARTLGKDHSLSLELWSEPNYDVKIIAILISDPKKMDQAQIESMLTNVDMWMMSHTWVQNVLSKVSFAKELTEKWRKDSNELKRRCGYAYLYYFAKDKKIPDTYFYPILEQIKKTIQLEENFVKDAMNNALFSIGQRSKEMNFRCIEVAKAVGQITVDYGDNSCEAVDVIKHLNSDRVQKKFS